MNNKNQLYLLPLKMQVHLVLYLAKKKPKLFLYLAKKTKLVLYLNQSSVKVSFSMIEQFFFFLKGPFRDYIFYNSLKCSFFILFFHKIY